VLASNELAAGRLGDGFLPRSLPVCVPLEPVGLPHRLHQHLLPRHAANVEGDAVANKPAPAPALAIWLRRRPNGGPPVTSRLNRRRSPFEEK